MGGLWLLNVKEVVEAGKRVVAARAARARALQQCKEAAEKKEAADKKDADNKEAADKAADKAAEKAAKQDKEKSEKKEEGGADRNLLLHGTKDQHFCCEPQNDRTSWFATK